MQVTLVEQGRGLGGRVCTRKAEFEGGATTFDHGCQYLSAKSPMVKQLLEELNQKGIIDRWAVAWRGCCCERFVGCSTGHQPCIILC